MAKTKDIIFVVGIVAAAIVMFTFFNTEDSILSQSISSLNPVDFDEVLERDIVKNSIPIHLLSENGNSCTVKAETFFMIIDHQYFIRADELASELQFNEEESTIVVSCDQLHGEKSKLEVWYIIPEAQNHATKYDWWVSEWSETVHPT